MNWNVGDRAWFENLALGDLTGPVTITRILGEESDTYQFAVTSDDGRDWVATVDELEHIK